MGEGIEFPIAHPKILEPASREGKPLCMWCQDEMQYPFSPAELHPGPKPATLEGALLHPQASGS